MGRLQPTPILSQREDEISRTIYVGNVLTAVRRSMILPPHTHPARSHVLLFVQISVHDIIKFFSVVGPVAYARMAGDASQVARFAFVEFANAASCAKAILLNGSVLGDRPLKYA